MKILILTCHTGEGHNQAGHAIIEACQSHSIDCDMLDSLAFISDKTSDFISKWHDRLYRRFPKAFAKGYSFTERHSSVFDSDFKIYKFICKQSVALAEKIQKGNYDTVICVHPFAALMLTDAIANHGVTAKTAFVSTDYSCVPCVSNTNLDIYFIPHEHLKDDFEEKGIPAEKIVPLRGVPVKSKFFFLIHDKRTTAEAVVLFIFL